MAGLGGSAGASAAALASGLVQVWVQLVHPLLPCCIPMPHTCGLVHLSPSFPHPPPPPPPYFSPLQVQQPVQHMLSKELQLYFDKVREGWSKWVPPEGGWAAGVP